jgi:AmmeMemoRadiSam system protein A
MIISKILGDDNVLIVSGDLSHRLLDSGSYDYDEMGKVYDSYIVSSIKDNEYINILDIDHDMVERAGQCAQKPLQLFIGALEGYETTSEVYSYEGPFGVGYMTAKIIRGENSGYSVFDEYLNRTKNAYTRMLENEDEYVSLARNTINQYISKRTKIDVPQDLTKELYENKNGVFVSIKKEGRLRGCIGTISPTKENIAQEIIDNAISASTRDPRFNPIEEHELHDLQISVDILFPPEDITSKNELDVKRYGVIVSSGIKKGLLLPNLDGVDTIDQQISISLEKAGIKPYEDYSLQRFEVVRHK